MSKWFEYETFVVKLDGSIHEDEQARTLLHERGRFGWKLQFCVPIVDAEEDFGGNRFTLIFEREREGEKASGAGA